MTDSTQCVRTGEQLSNIYGNQSRICPKIFSFLFAMNNTIIIITSNKTHSDDRMYKQKLVAFVQPLFLLFNKKIEILDDIYGLVCSK